MKNDVDMEKLIDELIKASDRYAKYRYEKRFEECNAIKEKRELVKRKNQVNIIKDQLIAEINRLKELYSSACEELSAS